jgi:hypothetical protein
MMDKKQTSQKMMNFFLVFLTFTFFVVTRLEAKCLDKCQFIPSFEWREQCNTCLEIPWCARLCVLFLSRYACARAKCLSLFFFYSLVLSKTYVLPAYFFSQKNSFRWCSFTAYIYEGIERGCALYCEGYVNPRGYEQKQFVRYGSGFVPIRYDVNPGYLAHG